MLAELQILLLQRMLGIDEEHDDLGEADHAQRIGDGELLGLLGDSCLAAQARGIEERDGTPFPVELRGNGIAREARLRSRDHPLLFEQRVDERRLAGVGAPDDGEAERPGTGGRGSAAVVGATVLPGSRGTRARPLRVLQVLRDLLRRPGLEQGHPDPVDLVLQVADALAMLGRDGDGFAETELEGVIEAFRSGPALALVGNEEHRLAGPPHECSKRLIGMSDARPCIDHEQHQIGLGDGTLRLLAHTGRNAAGRGLLEARRVDEDRRLARDRSLRLAPVAREAGHGIHEREPPAGETVEQRRLADIGPADDGEGKRHAQSASEKGRKPVSSGFGRCSHDMP